MQPNIKLSFIITDYKKQDSLSSMTEIKRNGKVSSKESDPSYLFKADKLVGRIDLLLSLSKHPMHVIDHDLVHDPPLPK